jgi:hypothetical protein
MSSSTFIGLAAMLLEAYGSVKADFFVYPEKRAYILKLSRIASTHAKLGGYLSACRLALGVGLLFLSAPAFAQEAGPPAALAGESPEAVAFIVPRPQGGEQDVPFLRVLAAALRIGLAARGLEARLPEESSLPALAAAPLRRLLEEAAGADFLILEGYTSTGQTIHMEVEVLRVQDGERLASASTSRRIDLRLDEAVDTVAAQLVSQMEPYVAEAVRERQQAAAAAEAQARAAHAPPPEELAVAAGASPQPEPLPAEQPAVELEPPSKRRHERRLELGAGGATFFPMAELGALYRFGYLAEAYLDHRVRTKAAAFAFGVYAGYAGLLPVEQGTGSFFSALLPIGLDLRLGTSEQSRLGVHVRMQAGAALNLSSQAKVDQRLTRVLPQIKAGAGLCLALTPRMGLSLDFLYELLLYMYMQGGALTVEPIMGFNVPSLSYYFRW